MSSKLLALFALALCACQHTVVPPSSDRVVFSETVHVNERVWTELTCTRQPADAPLRCTIHNSGAPGGQGHVDVIFNNRRNNESISYTDNVWNLRHDGSGDFVMPLDHDKIAQLCGPDLRECYVYVNYETSNVCGWVCP